MIARAHISSRHNDFAAALRWRRHRRENFDFAAVRRREIERHALHVGAAATDDLPRWLIAWHWHNQSSKDPVGAICEAARKMGRNSFTPAEAEAVIEEASTTRRCCSADRLAGYLGVTYRDREAVKLTTIGSTDVGPRSRRELRKLKARRRDERRRRSRGAIPRPQYEANALSRTKPWKAIGMSRRSWYRHRKAGTSGTGPRAAIPPLKDGTSPCAAPLSTLAPNGPVPMATPQGDSRGRTRRKAGEAKRARR
jgi:hypothetical protein